MMSAERATVIANFKSMFDYEEQEAEEDKNRFNFAKYWKEHNLKTIDDVGAYAKDHDLKMKNMPITV